MPYEALMAETVNVQGYQNETIESYLARPLGAGPYPGVVVIHHMPGWDEASKEIVRKFAYHGYVAISPHLHVRESRLDPPETFETLRAKRGIPDAQCMGDLRGALAYIRSLPYLNGKVGIIGYCSGGRQAYMAACTLPGIDAAVDCYGARVIMQPEEISERHPQAPIDFTKDLPCPLLGLFGNDDMNPSPAQVNQTEAELKKWNKTYSFHRYDGAGHSLFAVDQDAYRPAAARDGWERIFQWFGKYLR
jgi:carboxymethylenebutenolidase